MKFSIRLLTPYLRGLQPQGHLWPGQQAEMDESSGRREEERQGTGGCIQNKTPSSPAHSLQTHLPLHSASGPPGCNPCSKTHHPPLRGHLNLLPPQAAHSICSPSLSVVLVSIHTFLTNVTSTVPRVSLPQSSPVIGCRRCLCTPGQSLLRDKPLGLLPLSCM